MDNAMGNAMPVIFADLAASLPFGSEGVEYELLSLLSRICDDYGYQASAPGGNAPVNNVHPVAGNSPVGNQSAMVTGGAHSIAHNDPVGNQFVMAAGSVQPVAQNIPATNQFVMATGNSQAVAQSVPVVNQFVMAHGNAQAVAQSIPVANQLVVATGSAESVVHDSQITMGTNLDGSKEHIPRPRNSFILYRQWMSRKLRAENPGLTAGSISQIVASMWRAESKEVKEHFLALSKKDEGRHRIKYPNYKYEARRVIVANLRRASRAQINPAKRLILGGVYQM